MLKNSSVTLSVVQGNEKEYIIRDNSGITIGRIFIIELSKENEWCSIRIKMYKQEGVSYTYLKDALTLLLNSLFKRMHMHRVNVMADEDINTTVFVDMGFDLEGIYSHSIKVNNFYKDELIFGISKAAFEAGLRENPLKVSGKNIELKVLTPEDAKTLMDYYIRNREHLEHFEPTREESFYSLEQQRRILIESYKQFLNGTSVNFGIYRGEEFIGKLQVSNIVMGILKSAIVGYSIDKDNQGKGYMKEALNLAMEYAFQDMGLHRIEASTLIDNVRSQGVLRACGFNELGVNKNYLYIDGEWKDHKTFYKINDNM